MATAIGALAAAPFALASFELALTGWSDGRGGLTEAGTHVLAFAPLLVVGLAGVMGVRTAHDDQRRGGGALATLAAGWLLAGALAAVPFTLAAVLASDPSPTLAAFRDPFVALFEAVSGVTGTGLSVSRDASELSAPLQLYRSMLQWVGSVGLLLCGLALADRSRGAYERHEHQIGAERTTDALAKRVRSPVAAIWSSYGVLTALAAFAFLASGMPPWEAVNHALTGISTGGFTITSDSFQSYGTGPLIVGATVMVAGALSFCIHACVLSVRVPPPSERAQAWGYLGVLAAGLPLVWLFAVSGAPGAPVDEASSGAASWARAAFQWTSALTTTGFSADALSDWSAGGLLLLAFGMFAGACSGSTGGGLKMRRAITVAQGIGRRVVTAARDGEDDEGEDDQGEGGDGTLDRRVQDASARLSLLTMVLGTGLLAVLATAPADTPFANALLDATAALSTAGLTTGFVGPDLPSGTLLTFCALMVLGRLEVIAVLVLLMTGLRRLRSPRRRRPPPDRRA